jgi:predicted dehydrogenase
MATKSRRRIKYAVLGQGYISQIAVLPAFAHARESCELVALVSDDPEKAAKLAHQYEVPRVYGYEDFDECLASGIDAVFIALPNTMHAVYAIRAAQAGVHVLCEKPMATTSHACLAMIAAAEEHHVRLMIAYRLHFEEGTLRALQIARSGRLGDLRLFSSAFSTPVTDVTNIRLRREVGGGTLYDIGIYCINAARAVFGAEPIDVFAMEATGPEPRFAEVGMSTTATLRFPGDRLATFACSFDGCDHSSYEIVGNKGSLRVSPAFDFAGPICHQLSLRGRTRTTRFTARDQFAPELLYFARCILEEREPEPSGREGLADIRVIEALEESLQMERPIRLPPYERDQRPQLSQELHAPAVHPPRLFHALTPRGQTH